MQTGCEGVFAGGDMVPFDRTVTTAIGHGKKAARSIDAWLRGTNDRTRPKHDLATFEMLRLWYHAEAQTPRAEHDRHPAPVRRRSTKSSAGLDRRGGALRGAAMPVVRQLLRVRWLLLGVPGGQAVIKLGPGRRYRYDFDKCTGCAICYDQCPCGAIDDGR